MYLIAHTFSHKSYYQGRRKSIGSEDIGSLSKGRHDDDAWSARGLRRRRSVTNRRWRHFLILLTQDACLNARNAWRNGGGRYAGDTPYNTHQMATKENNNNHYNNNGRSNRRDNHHSIWILYHYMRQAWSYWVPQRLGKLVPTDFRLSRPHRRSPQIRTLKSSQIAPCSLLRNKER